MRFRPFAGRNGARTGWPEVVVAAVWLAGATLGWTGAGAAAAETEVAQPTPTATAAAPRAAAPVSLRIDALGVDATIETREIVGGALQDPTGPWVVAWYRETARPGEAGNVVLGGHVDYWTTGPAVFFALGGLVPGSEISVTAADGQEHVYAVDWVALYPLTDLAPRLLRRIVGPTDRPSLTLITCGGVFDPAQGEYDARLVVRATRLPNAVAARG